MTQSNDGTGNTPGNGARGPGQRPPAGIADGHADLPRLPSPPVAQPAAVPARDSDTDEMQDLLRRIASQIADAEQRQASELDGARSRLNDIVGQAGAAKEQAPEPLKSELGAIEGRIAGVAHSLDAMSRDGQRAVAGIPGGATAATNANMHVRGFGRGQVRGSNETSGTAKPAATATADLEASNPWDQKSADALANIFRDEDETAGGSDAMAAARPHSVPKSDLKQPRTEPPALASARTLPPGASPASTAQPVAGSLTAASAPHGAGGRGAPPPITTSVKPAANPPPPGVPPRLPPLSLPPATAPSPGMSDPDRDWLNARFADIAGQLERSLKESRPERAVSALAQRFDKLEANLAGVMSALRGDGESGVGTTALGALDQQVAQLQQQVLVIVQRLASLDAMKSDVAALAQKLGALDRLETAQTEVAAQLAGTRSGIDHVTRAVQDISSGRRTSTATGSASDEYLSGLQAMIEVQTNERRDSEAATVAVLQAIQGAIDQLSDRMLQFEDAVTATVLAGSQPAAESLATQLDHARPPAEPPAPAQLTPGTRGETNGRLWRRSSHRQEIAPAPAANPEPLPEPAYQPGPEPAVRNEVIAERLGARHEPPAATEATIPSVRRGLGKVTLSPDAFAADVGDAHIRGRPEIRQARGEDMLTTARRAAAASPEVPPEGDVHGDVETVAARLPGQKRPRSRTERGGFFTFEKGGMRPLPVVLLVALLAAGAGMLYGVMGDRQPSLRMDKPRAGVGKLSQLHSARDAVSRSEAQPAAADETDAPASRQITGAPGVGRALPAGARSEARRSTDDIDDAEMRAADRNEAALSILKPSADTEPANLHTSSSATAGGGETSSITTGILIDAGAPLPSVHDLRRYSQEQRMARISSQLGDKAVQKTERELSTPPAMANPAPAPASHTLDAARATVRPENAAPVAAGSPSAAGMPPAQIGPMSLRVAAAKGDPSAEFEVASRFAQGRGVPKDFVKAAEWYQRAASHGSAPAQYRLGGIYERGIGLAVDPARARAWYQRAAELGNVKAMHNLAVLHTQRDGDEPDYASASQWFAKAASYGLSDSQFNLAILHENGMGVPKNLAEAFKWYSLAAEKGDAEAVKRRAAVAAKLPAAEVERARASLARWRPQMTDPAANDPMLAGQAWRERLGLEQTGNAEASADLSPRRPLAHPSAAVAAPQVGSQTSAPARRGPPREAEIIDLTASAMEPRKNEAASLLNAPSLLQDSPAMPAPQPRPPAEAASGEAPVGMMGAKRKVVRVQNPTDVERMLTQFGYNPTALKQARPGAETPKREGAEE